jgi:hypothetical protein
VSSEPPCLIDDPLGRNSGAECHSEGFSGILLLFSPWIDCPEVLEIDGMRINDIVNAMTAVTAMTAIDGRGSNASNGVMQGGFIVGSNVGIGFITVC